MTPHQHLVQAMYAAAFFEDALTTGQCLSDRGAAADGAGGGGGDAQLISRKQRDRTDSVGTKDSVAAKSPTFSTYAFSPTPISSTPATWSGKAHSDLDGDSHIALDAQVFSSAMLL